MDLIFQPKVNCPKHGILRLAFMLLLLGLPLTPTLADNGGFSLITSVHAPAFSEKELFDTKKLRAIFSGKKQHLETGYIQTLFMLPEKHDAITDFIKNKLKTQVYRLRKTWHIQRYTGSGKPPVTLPSYQDIVSKVKVEKQSIGLVPSDMEVDDLFIKVDL